MPFKRFSLARYHLTALQNLPYLTYIDLDWNSITDLTPLDTNAANYYNSVYVSLNGNSYLQNNQITIAPEMITLVYDNWTVNYNVQFGDNGLQSAIQTVLLNSHILTPCDCDYSITPNDMATLATLDVSDYPINSVEGLEFCTGLYTLDLEWNQISDLTPLSDLTGLYSLNLAHNQISNLTGLDNLTNLYDLDLSYNQILNNGDTNNLGHLANMTNLNYLGLDFNNISDFTSLLSGPYGLPSLIELEISGNQITSIPSPLYNGSYQSLVPSLQNLYLEANQITDLYSLEDLADTTGASYVNLYVTGNPISLQDCGVYSEVYDLQNNYSWTVWGYDSNTAAGNCD